MRRLWAALSALLLLALICILGMYYINKHTNELKEILIKAEAAADSGDYKSAAAFSESAEQSWVKSEKVLYLFVNHFDVTQIGLTLAKLSPLIKNNDLPGFYAELNSAMVQLIHISESEIMGFHSK